MFLMNPRRFLSSMRQFSWMAAPGGYLEPATHRLRVFASFRRVMFSVAWAFDGVNHWTQSLMVGIAA